MRIFLHSHIFTFAYFYIPSIYTYMKLAEHKNKYWGRLEIWPIEFSGKGIFGQKNFFQKCRPNIFCQQILG